MDSPFVGQLRDDLSARLVLLEREAKIIRRTLRVLGERPASGTKRSLAEDVVRELHASPGSRASLLALTLRRDVTEVQAVLRRLEVANAVERDGLGWRVSEG
jgi:hypothetical protein